MTKPITSNIRIRDREAWERFKELAALQNLSANGLLNQLIVQYVARRTTTTIKTP